MICFRERAWSDDLYWQQTDRKILKRINTLIRDIERDPAAGIGKPEALKHERSRLSSRRINEEHRLVYTLMDGELVIVQCRYHY